MKKYEGYRDPDRGCMVTVDGEPLDLRLDLRDHSPTGFEWGYGGSGPSQLALAILADLLDDDTALKYYQDFKRGCISRIGSERWNLSEDAIKEWLRLEVQYQEHAAEVEAEDKITKIPSFKVPYSGNA